MRTTTVQLDKCNPDLMLAALKALNLGGWLDSSGVLHFGNGETIDTKTGQSRLSDLRDVNELKRAYSREVVTFTARKYGWQQQAKKQVNGLEQVIYQRR